MVVVRARAGFMTTAQAEQLFTGMIDDAILYAPASLKLADAVRAHVGHRLSWYADLLGRFVCNAGRVPALDAAVARIGLAPVDVAVVVADGISAVGAAVAAVDTYEQVRLRSVEVPLGTDRLREARRALAPLVERQLEVYLEVPVVRVSERVAHELSAAGLRLKLRTGGTNVDEFQSEVELAMPIVKCAAELLPFKCTAGLHRAVRHRDRGTMFEHHGFLNVALAAQAAAATGSEAATSEALAERDPVTVAGRVRALTDPSVRSVRELFASFGTGKITEPVRDLVALGLVSAA
ncbi:MAG: hypothetical protein ABI808_10770 [Pseudonocardiales bacterium]